MSNAPITIEELKRRAGADHSQAALHVQIDGLAVKQTREQKPYLEVHFRDNTGNFSLRVWNDHPSYAFASQLRSGDFVEIQGDFFLSQNFGLDLRNWSVRLLQAEERSAVLAGPAEVRQRQDNDLASIEAFIRSIQDPRLHWLCKLFLAEFGERFRRSAGARNYHHARRGGLLEHVAQMMRSADALAQVYPALNRDLLLAGAVFHDAGKLWENCFAKDSFIMPYDIRGELVGHISIGIEVVNRLWQKLKELPEFPQWNTLVPDSEAVRLHLIHLVGSHHGEKQFGSPVDPKTPEAIALHLIDNLDAKLEMISRAYETANRLTGQISERVRPLPGNIVQPLEKFQGD